MSSAKRLASQFGVILLVLLLLLLLLLRWPYLMLYEDQIHEASCRSAVTYHQTISSNSI